MRKFYTTLVGVAIVLIAQGQSTTRVPQVKKEAQKSAKMELKSESVVPESINSFSGEERMTIQPTLDFDFRSTFFETKIGTTIYDLQTNGSVQNRVARTGDNVSAGFTFSTETDNYTDRGTGYNFYDGEAWDEEPYQRLETVRVGWPSVMHTGSGHEVIITHDGTLGLVMIKRTIGSETDWVQSDIPNPSGRDLIWARAVAGGSDGNSIHLIVVTEPIANEGTEYEGLDGALIYYRSLDGGTNWDIQGDILPGLDSTQFVAFGGDTYSIQAKGDKVAFAVFNDLADAVVMISEDNGDNWTKRTLVDFPVDMYVLDTGIDLDNDAVADTVYGTDNSGTLFIDSSNTIHCFWGDMEYVDDDLTDANFSYFPATNGISYWNEDYNDAEFDTSVVFTPDFNGNDTIDIATIDNIALFFTSIASFPNVAEDEDGRLYLVFSGVHEGFVSSSTDQHFRHVMLSTSDDNGATWSDATDLTPELDPDEIVGLESIFASVSPIVDDKLCMTFQRDFEPGLHVRGDLDDADDNEIIYFCITTDLVVEPTVLEHFLQGGLAVYPNPANELVTITAKENFIGSQIEVVNILGEVVMKSTAQIDNVELNISTLSAGVYTVNSVLEGKLISSKLIVE